MIVVDIEANGLLPEATEVWCICMHNREMKTNYSFAPETLDEALLVLDSNATLIMHNGIDYDVPLLKKIFNFDFKGKVVDTMILSQLLFPERPGGHSLAAWGDRLGFAKVEHEDWTQYSPEMLHRCETDVRLTNMVYEALCKEAGEVLEGVVIPTYRFM